MTLLLAVLLAPVAGLDRISLGLTLHCYACTCTWPWFVSQDVRVHHGASRGMRRALPQRAALAISSMLRLMMSLVTVQRRLYYASQVNFAQRSDMLLAAVRRCVFWKTRGNLRDRRQCDPYSVRSASLRVKQSHCRQTPTPEQSLITSFGAPSVNQPTLC